MNAICPLWNQMKINNNYLSSMDKSIHPSSQTGVNIYLPNQMYKIQIYTSNNHTNQINLIHHLLIQIEMIKYHTNLMKKYIQY